MYDLAWHDEGVDDRALVDAVLAGDRDAFEIVVERESTAVFRVCLRILGRPRDAEDATQETFGESLAFDLAITGRDR
jgi:DNA-directed RNA polymerase specialized sigma24 family protein